MKHSILLLFIIVLSISCVTPEKEYDQRTYNVYMRGNLAGQHTSALDSNGTYVYTFHFNDRGRGPEIEERIELNDDGLISSLEISGVNYLKDQVEESFSIDDGEAKWKSTSEEGSTSAAGNAFYSSINGTIGDMELLVQKLLTTSSHTLDLLPSGQVRIASIESMNIEGNQLRLIALTGFSFTPHYLWIDNEDRIFGSISSWLSIIEEDHANLTEELLEIQTKKENALFGKFAKELTTKPEETTVIKNVNLFDSKAGQIIPNQSVVINGNTITEILNQDASIPKNATVIDGTNKTLLPGLFDNHCHVQRQDGILHLAAGVTSVRDMANSMELIDMRKDFDSNRSIGPRVVTMAGFIDQKGPFAGPGLTITNVEEGFEAIQNYKDSGYHQIKLYSSIDPSWVQPLAAKTHELGLKLSGHIPAHMLAEEAINDGFDEIQHVNMLVLNFLSDTIDTRTPLRFSAVAEHAHGLDLNSVAFKNFIKLLKDKNIDIDPTVSIFEGMFTTKAGDPDPQFEAVIDRLPIQIQRGFYLGGLPIPEGQEQIYKNSFRKLLDIVHHLHINGITILPGTDATAGFALHKELENYVLAGIPTNEVLQMATLTSAQESWVDDTLGSIEKGKLADMILVDGNPVENISDIRRIVLTIKDGKIYNPKDLYAALGIQHFE